MSVYTRVERDELQRVLQNYPLGQLLDYIGIADGIENTNYRLTTTQGDWVLTVFECLDEAELGYFLQLLQYLQHHGYPCPEPQTDKDGRMLNRLADKPLAIFKRIPGISINQPTFAQCQQVGTHLAQLHQDGQNFPARRRNSMNLPWCYQVAEKIRPRINSADYQCITAELAFQAGYLEVKLPQGLVHGDLFKDNVLFDNDRLTGVLDFYNACHDSFLLDVAITANDWCHELNGQINRDKLACFLDSYQRGRVFTSIEQTLLPVALRKAALYFWLGRLEHQLFPRPAELTQPKDPSVYQSLLQQHQDWKKP